MSDTIESTNTNESTYIFQDYLDKVEKLENDKKLLDLGFIKEIPLLGKANEYVKVCTLPPLYVNFGFKKDNLLYMKNNHIYSLQLENGIYDETKDNIHYHALGADLMREIPSLLISPDMIFMDTAENKRKQGYLDSSLACCLDYSIKVNDENCPLIAIIEPPKNPTENIAVIFSVYPKDNYRNFIINGIKENRLLYVKDEKTLARNTGATKFDFNSSLVDFFTTSVVFRSFNDINISNYIENVNLERIKENASYFIDISENEKTKKVCFAAFRKNPFLINFFPQKYKTVENYSQIFGSTYNEKNETKPISKELKKELKKIFKQNKTKAIQSIPDDCLLETIKLYLSNTIDCSKEPRILVSTIEHLLSSKQQNILNKAYAHTGIPDMNDKILSFVEWSNGNLVLKEKPLSKTPTITQTVDNFTKNPAGVLDIIGTKIELDKNGSTNQKSLENLAKTLEIYSDKRYETARYIFLKDGECIRHVAVSSKTPSSTVIMPDKDFLYRLKDYAEQTNSQIVFCHNHPSGYVEPSEQDIKLTKYVQNIFNTGNFDKNGNSTNKEYFAGHVILDHDTYGIYTPQNDWKAYSNGKYYPIEKTPYTYQISKNEYNLQLKTDTDLLRLSTFINEKINTQNEWNKKEWIPVTFTNLNGMVKSIEFVSVSEFDNPQQLQEKLRNIGRENNSENIYFIPYKNDYAQMALCEEFAKNTRLVKDIYFENDVNGFELSEYSGGNLFPDYIKNEVSVEDTENFSKEEYLLARENNTLKESSNESEQSREEKIEFEKKSENEIPHLKTYKTLKKKKIENLEIVSDEEFSNIIDSLFARDYKSIPSVIKLPCIQKELSKLAGLENDSTFILQSRMIHINPLRKSEYNQSLTQNEYKQIPSIIRNTNYLVIDKFQNNFQILFEDENNTTKINKIVFNKDQLGNYIVTVGKVDRIFGLSEKQNQVVAVGLAPTISELRNINYKASPTTTLRPSTTTTLNIQHENSPVNNNSQNTTINIPIIQKQGEKNMNETIEEVLKNTEKEENKTNELAYVDFDNADETFAKFQELTDLDNLNPEQAINLAQINAYAEYLVSKIDVSKLTPEQAVQFDYYMRIAMLNPSIDENEINKRKLMEEELHKKIDEYNREEEINISEETTPEKIEENEKKWEELIYSEDSQKLVETTLEDILVEQDLQDAKKEIIDTISLSSLVDLKTIDYDDNAKKILAEKIEEKGEEFKHAVNLEYLKQVAVHEILSEKNITNEQYDELLAKVERIGTGNAEKDDSISNKEAMFLKEIQERTGTYLATLESANVNVVYKNKEFLQNAINIVNGVEIQHAVIKDAHIAKETGAKPNKSLKNHWKQFSENHHFIAKCAKFATTFGFSVAKTAIVSTVAGAPGLAVLSAYNTVKHIRKSYKNFKQKTNTKGFNNYLKYLKEPENRGEVIGLVSQVAASTISGIFSFDANATNMVIGGITGRRLASTISTSTIGIVKGINAHSVRTKSIKEIEEIYAKYNKEISEFDIKILESGKNPLEIQSKIMSLTDQQISQEDMNRLSDLVVTSKNNHSFKSAASNIVGAGIGMAISVGAFDSIQDKVTEFSTPFIPKNPLEEVKSTLIGKDFDVHDIENETQNDDITWKFGDFTGEKEISAEEEYFTHLAKLEEDGNLVEPNLDESSLEKTAMNNDFHIGNKVSEQDISLKDNEINIEENVSDENFTSINDIQIQKEELNKQIEENNKIIDDCTKEYKEMLKKIEIQKPIRQRIIYDKEKDKKMLLEEWKSLGLIDKETTIADFDARYVFQEDRVALKWKTADLILKNDEILKKLKSLDKTENQLEKMSKESPIQETSQKIIEESIQKAPQNIVEETINNIKPQSTSVLDYLKKNADKYTSLMTKWSVFDLQDAKVDSVIQQMESIKDTDKSKTQPTLSKLRSNDAPPNHPNKNYVSIDDDIPPSSLAARSNNDTNVKSKNSNIPNVNDNMVMRESVPNSPNDDRNIKFISYPSNHEFSGNNVNLIKTFRNKLLSLNILSKADDIYLVPLSYLKDKNIEIKDEIPEIELTQLVKDENGKGTFPKEKYYPLKCFPELTKTQEMNKSEHEFNKENAYQKYIQVPDFVIKDINTGKDLEIKNARFHSINENNEVILVCESKDGKQNSIAIPESKYQKIIEATETFKNNVKDKAKDSYSYILENEEYRAALGLDKNVFRSNTVANFTHNFKVLAEKNPNLSYSGLMDKADKELTQKMNPFDKNQMNRINKQYPQERAMLFRRIYDNNFVEGQEIDKNFNYKKMNYSQGQNIKLTLTGEKANTSYVIESINKDGSYVLCNPENKNIKFKLSEKEFTGKVKEIEKENKKEYKRHQKVDYYGR